ncbi:membrane hypothetical protein [Nitrospina gracilis 3/211]|uniref:CDP-alcohol phosphatidyltransferase n=1 Tax=Nitrospina gracilis (strain 3/211) TaxID=1266370 RepID=M1YHC7_NITG3|nr:membrane hypothetical protein [Nitrospina gracilis 3/211]
MVLGCVEFSTKESPDTGSHELDNTAVLFLTDPPDTAELSGWYARKIVGVPFLLLNLLHLQKAGVQSVTVYHRGLLGGQKGRMIPLTEDPRLRIPVEWESDPARLAARLNENACRLVVNGSALHWHTDLAGVLKEPSDTDLLARTQVYEVPKDTAPEALATCLNEFSLAETRKIGRVPGPQNLDTVRLVAGDHNRWVQTKDDFHRLHEQLLKLGGMSNDSPMDRLVTRHMSRHLTRLFIRTPLTPNQITWAHLVLGLVSGWYFYLGGYGNQLTGALLLMLSAWLDSTDGEIARLRFQQSPFGGMLDIVADNVVHFAVFLGIGLGLYRMTGNAAYSYLGVVAVAGSLTCFLLLQSDIFSQRTTGSSDAPAEEAESLVDQIANRDFIYFLFAMAVVNLLEIFIVVTAIGSVVFAGYVAYSRFKPQSRTQGQGLQLK